MTTALYALVVFVALVAAAPPSRAQTPAEAAMQSLERNEQLQRQQIEQDRARQLPQRNPFREKTKPAAGQDVAPPPAAPAQGCRHYDTIALKGVTQLLHRDQDALVAPYRHRCLSLTEIEALAASISRFYIEKGYITTRAYLDAATLETPALQIVVVEGILAQFEIEDGGQRSVPVDTLFPGAVGRPLNLRDIEEGIEHLNLLASNNATVEILPGEAIGTSVVRVVNQPKTPWHVYTSVDNYGADNSGRLQGSAGVTLDNLLGLSDVFSGTVRRSSPWNGLPYRAQSYSLMHSVPYGYHMFSLGWQGSQYRQTITLPSGIQLAANGESSGFFGKWENMLYRNQDMQLVLGSRLRRDASWNYFADQPLAMQSPTLTVLDLDLDIRHRAYHGWITLGVGYSRGLRGLGATRDTANSELPRAQFDLLRATAAASLPVFIGKHTFLLTSAMNGQWSGRRLYSPSQILIGGPYTVRGYEKTAASGSTGLYVRNDLAYVLQGTLWGTRASLQPYLGVDAGRIWRANSSAHASTAFLGLTLGVRAGWGPLSLDASYSRPSPWPRAFPQEKGHFFLRATLNF
ncbi:ShlB/FhaC/HecB family hemolysin secretion/activation protein [Cupriavidus necator]